MMQKASKGGHAMQKTSEAKIAEAQRLYDTGVSWQDIASITGLSSATLQRHLKKDRVQRIADKDLIILSYELGEPNDRICRSFNITPRQLYDVVHAAGVYEYREKAKACSITDEKIEAIRRLYAEGLTYKQIMKELQVSCRAIRKYKQGSRPINTLGLNVSRHILSDAEREEIKELIRQKAKVVYICTKYHIGAKRYKELKDEANE